MREPEARHVLERLWPVAASLVIGTIIGLLVWWPTAAGAAEPAPMASKGQIELGLETSGISSGSLEAVIQSSTVKTESTVADLHLSVGYLFTDALELTASRDVKTTKTTTTVGGALSTTTTSAGFGLGMAYNFHPGRVIPFLSVKFSGLTLNSESAQARAAANTFALVFGGGLHLPLADRVAVRLVASYARLLGGTLDLGGGASGTLTGQNFDLLAGLSVFLR